MIDCWKLGEELYYPSAWGLPQCPFFSGFTKGAVPCGFLFTIKAKMAVDVIVHVCICYVASQYYCCVIAKWFLMLSGVKTSRSLLLVFNPIPCRNGIVAEEQESAGSSICVRVCLFVCLFVLILAIGILLPCCSLSCKLIVRLPFEADCA